jgi:hypothetical protein
MNRVSEASICLRMSVSLSWHRVRSRSLTTTGIVLPPLPRCRLILKRAGVNRLFTPGVALELSRLASPPSPSWRSARKRALPAKD